MTQPKLDLHGWKEISAYIGRDERVARRWHKQYGMPVYTFEPTRDVHASKQELAEWKNSRMRPRR